MAEEEKSFADRFVTYKAFVGSIFGLLIFLYTIMASFGDRLHPDAVNIREMQALSLDLKSDIGRNHDLLRELLKNKNNVLPIP